MSYPYYYKEITALKTLEFIEGSEWLLHRRFVSLRENPIPTALYPLTITPPCPIPVALFTKYFVGNVLR